MSCPTCSHTMQHVAGTGRVFWCERCGTLADVPLGESASLEGSSVPKLVERCREFGLHIKNRTVKVNVEAWVNLGISESINTPENRS